MSMSESPLIRVDKDFLKFIKEFQKRYAIPNTPEATRELMRMFKEYRKHVRKMKKVKWDVGINL